MHRAAGAALGRGGRQHAAGAYHCGQGGESRGAGVTQAQGRSALQLAGQALRDTRRGSSERMLCSWLRVLIRACAVGITQPVPVPMPGAKAGGSWAAPVHSTAPPIPTHGTPPSRLTRAQRHCGVDVAQEQLGIECAAARRQLHLVWPAGQGGGGRQAGGRSGGRLGRRRGGAEARLVLHACWGWALHGLQHECGPRSGHPHR